MAKTVDILDKDVAAFNTKNIAETNAKNEEKGLPLEPTLEQLEASRVGELPNASSAVGADGRVSSRDAPADSTATPTGTPTGTENTGTNRGRGSAPGVVPAAAPNRPNAETVRRNIATPIMSSDELKVKAKNFAAPDVENGLWATLDKKMEAALQGSTPEEVAQNMAMAAWTFLFELIGNWADHHRKEAKRVKKENEERLATYDHNMGAEAVHKNLAVWAVIADHPAIRQIVGNGTLDKAARKKVAKAIQKDPKMHKALFDIVNAMTLRKHDSAELNKIIKNAMNMDLDGATLDDVKGAALDQDVILRAASRVGLRTQVEDTHRAVTGHEEEVDANRRNRDTLNNARTSGRSSPTPERTPERTAEAAR